MIGAIIFTHENYTETVINETGTTQLVDCSTNGINNLYRIEYTDNGNNTHQVAYNPDTANKTFTRIANQH